MTRRPRGPSVGPRKDEWIDAANKAEDGLMLMVGRTDGSIPAVIRDEIARYIAPLTALLRRAGLRK